MGISGENKKVTQVRAMSSQCSFCGHGNPPGAKYCNECGSPLNFKPCAECGAVNEGSAPGCYKCGAKLADQPAGTEDPRDTRAAANAEFPAASHGGLPQTIPAFDSPWNERRNVRVGRLTLSILIATTAAVAGYVAHGLSAGDEVKPHSVATSQGGAMSNSNAVPSRMTDAPTAAAGDSTVTGNTGNGAGPPAAQAAAGATTTNEPAHEDAVTSTSNSLPPVSPPSSDVPASAETPSAVVDHDPNQATAGDAKSSGHAPAPGEHRPAGSHARTGPTGSSAGADATRMRTPAARASGKPSTGRTCTQQQRILGLCE